MATNSARGPWRRKPLWAVSSSPDHDRPQTGEISSLIPSPKSSPQHSRSSSSSASASASADGVGGGGGGGGHHPLRRHLTLTDLLSVGVGGTVGSGIFVLCGAIARDYAGPATCLSWLIAGTAAALSGTCYAELAGRIPSDGSTYVYSFVSMGELPAVIAAACLTLEYVVSGAAVARSWGDKVVLWLRDDLLAGGDGDGSVSESSGGWVSYYLDPGYGINPMAFVVSAACVALLLDGVKESKAVTNVFTISKVCLVAFMTIGGFAMLRPSNLTPFIPPQFGAAGVLRGATSSFFGFVGYDEVCCLAGEAVDPRRDMPRAVLLTILIVTVLYVLAALALTGMVPYTEISAASGFPEAFRYRGYGWAAQIAAAGEVLTMPVVVLISLMAQPRLQFALAQDGLLPSLFREVDRTGNLRKGTMISGVTMTAVATFVPFEYLNDLISSGILVAFCMTDSALILLRMDSPDDHPRLLPRTLFAFNVSCFASGALLSGSGGYLGTPWRNAFGAASVFVVAALVLRIARRCPLSSRFGGKAAETVGEVGDHGCRCLTTEEEQEAERRSEEGYFRTPLVPYLPCLGTYVNWYLIAQLEARGMAMLAFYLGAAAGLYFFFRSSGNDHGPAGQQATEYREEGEGQTEGVLLRTISLPRRRKEGDSIGA